MGTSATAAPAPSCEGCGSPGAGDCHQSEAWGAPGLPLFIFQGLRDGIQVVKVCTGQCCSWGVGLTTTFGYWSCTFLTRWKAQKSLTMLVCPRDPGQTGTVLSASGTCKELLEVALHLNFFLFFSLLLYELFSLGRAVLWPISSVGRAVLWLLSSVGRTVFWLPAAESRSPHWLWGVPEVPFPVVSDWEAAVPSCGWMWWHGIVTLFSSLTGLMTPHHPS